jgi:hypothetical protein
MNSCVSYIGCDRPNRNRLNRSNARARGSRSPRILQGTCVKVAVTGRDDR